MHVPPRWPSLLIGLLTLALTAILALSAAAQQIQCDTERQTMRECADILAAQMAAASEAERTRIEARQDRANRYAFWCQAADGITTIIGLESGYSEANPTLSFLNSDDDTERYLGYAALLGLKYGLVRFVRATRSTADDWIAAGAGCGAAGWNLHKILE